MEITTHKWTLTLMVGASLALSSGCIETSPDEEERDETDELVDPPNEDDESEASRELPDHITLIQREIDSNDTWVNNLDVIEPDTGARLSDGLDQISVFTQDPAGDHPSFVLDWDFEAPGTRFFNVHFRKGNPDDDGVQEVSLFERDEDGDGGFPMNSEPDIQDHEADCFWTNQATVNCVAESPSLRHIGFDESLDLGDLWEGPGDTVTLDVSICRLSIFEGMQCNRYNVGDLQLN